MTDINLDVSIEAEKKRFEEFIDEKRRQIEEKEIEPPQDKPNSTKNCIENLFGDSLFCLRDAST
jgi:ferritin